MIQVLNLFKICVINFCLLIRLPVSLNNFCFQEKIVIKVTLSLRYTQIKYISINPYISRQICLFLLFHTTLTQFIAIHRNYCINQISYLFPYFSIVSIKYYLYYMTSYSSLPPSRTSSRSKKPSNYAKYIEEYQQQIIPKSTKKLKSQVELSNDIPVSSGQPKKNRKYTPCVLPDGKRLNLQILFSKASTAKPKPKVKKQTLEQNLTTQKKQSLPSENNLLSKFLFAFQQIEKNEKQVENDSVKNANSADIPIQNKKEPKQFKKKERDEDDKFAKYYEKIKKLDEKFLEVSQTLVFLL